MNQKRNFSKSQPSQVSQSTKVRSIELHQLDQNSLKKVNGESPGIANHSSDIERDIEIDLKIEGNFDLQKQKQRSQKKESIIVQFQVNRLFIFAYIMTMGLNGICIALSQGAINQTVGVFKAKLSWSDDQSRYYKTIINISSHLGQAFGAILAGKLIEYSRKNVYITFNFLSILSCLIMQILSIHTLIIGKFFNGFFVMIVHIAACKMLNETIPVYILGLCGPIIQFGIQFGFLLLIAFGKALPTPDFTSSINDEANNLIIQANAQDSFWRFIYLFPVFINISMLVLFVRCIKHEPIMYSLSKNDYQSSLNLIEKIYHKSEDRTKIVENLKLQVQKQNVKKLRYLQSLFGPRFLRGTITMMIFTSLTEQNGGNILMMHSNKAIQNLKTQLCCVAALISFGLIYRFKRIPILLVGQVLIGLCVLISSLLQFSKNELGTGYLMCIFQIAMQLTIAPIHWIYLPEVLSDIQFGFVTMIKCLNNIEQSIFSEFMVQFLKPEGAFLFYTFIIISGSLFIFYRMKETHGLNDKQKKQLYFPKKFIEREGKRKSKKNIGGLDTSMDKSENSMKLEQQQLEEMKKDWTEKLQLSFDTQEDSESQRKNKGLERLSTLEGDIETEKYENAGQKNGVQENLVYTELGQSTNRSEVVDYVQENEYHTIQSIQAQDNGFIQNVQSKPKLQIPEDQTNSSNQRSNLVNENSQDFESSLELKMKLEAQLTKEELIKKKKEELNLLKQKFQSRK